MATATASQAGRNAERVDLLKRDPELARALTGAMRPGNGAGSSLSASVVKLDRGPWEPDAREPSVDHLGFLVLDEAFDSLPGLRLA